MTAEGVELVYRLHGCLPFRLTCFASPDIFLEKLPSCPSLSLILHCLVWQLTCIYCYWGGIKSAHFLRVSSRAASISCWLPTCHKNNMLTVLWPSRWVLCCFLVTSEQISKSNLLHCLRWEWIQHIVLFNSQLLLSHFCLFQTIVESNQVLASFCFQQVFFLLSSHSGKFNSCSFFLNGSCIGSMETQSKWIADRVDRKSVV